MADEAPPPSAFSTTSTPGQAPPSTSQSLQRFRARDAPSDDLLAVLDNPLPHPAAHSAPQQQQLPPLKPCHDPVAQSLLPSPSQRQRPRSDDDDDDDDDDDAEPLPCPDIADHDDDSAVALQPPPAPQFRPRPVPVDPDSGAPTPWSPPIVGVLPPAIVASIAEELAVPLLGIVAAAAAGVATEHSSAADPAAFPDRRRLPIRSAAAEEEQGKTYTAVVTPATTTSRGSSIGETRASSPGVAIASPPPLSQHGYPLPFVQPSSYLRPRIPGSGTMSEKQQPLSPLDRDQMQGLKAIREFLKLRTSYDVLPMSFRLIVLDTDLLIKKSLAILIQNNIVSAPLWDSHNSTFAGLLTSTDFINVIQYYCQYPDEFSKLDQFRLTSLRDIEKAIGAMPLETVSVRPTRPLYEACRQMLKTRARRIPLVDVDDETNRETVVSVITQYRILKFIAVNNEHHTVLLKRPVRELGIGTYANIATATMRSTVLDVVHLMVKHNISCVPIVSRAGRVLNVFEAVDIILCIKGGTYDGLSDPVGDALCRRSDDYSGILTCSEEDRLDSIFETIRKSRVHRLIVVDDSHRLKGIISLSDILRYVLLHGEDEDANTTTTTSTTTTTTTTPSTTSL